MNTKLDAAVKRALSDESSKIILNVNSFIAPLNTPYALHNIIVVPKEGGNAAYEFYKKILENFDIDKIGEAVKAMKEDLGDSVSKNLLSDWGSSKDIGKIIWLLGDEDEDAVFSASELLFNKPTSNVRKKLKIRRGLEDTTDRFRVLSTVIKLLSAYDTNKLEPNRKIFFWLDGIESLILYTSKQYIPFTQALRELYDMTENHFVLVLNFSLTDSYDIRTLDFIIGKALKDRISETVIL